MPLRSRRGRRLADRLPHDLLGSLIDDLRTRLYGEVFDVLRIQIPHHHLSLQADEEQDLQRLRALADSL